MIRTIQRESTETVQAMGRAGAEVNSAVKLTDQAGSAFREIAVQLEASAGRTASIRQAVDAIEHVNRQLASTVTEAVTVARQNQQAAEAMGNWNSRMVDSLDRVGGVVEENKAATQNMAKDAGEVALSIETIAAVSQENSAATEEVSAAAQEMTDQVQAVSTSAQSLASMAEALQTLVARFTLTEPVAEAPAETTPIARPASVLTARSGARRVVRPRPVERIA